MTIGTRVTTFTGRHGVITALLPDLYRHGHDRVQVRITCDIVNDGGRDRKKPVEVLCTYRVQDVWVDTGEVADGT